MLRGIFKWDFPSVSPFRCVSISHPIPLFLLRKKSPFPPDSRTRLASFPCQRGLDPSLSENVYHGKETSERTTASTMHERTQGWPASHVQLYKQEKPSRKYNLLDSRIRFPGYVWQISRLNSRHIAFGVVLVSFAFSLSLSKVPLRARVTSRNRQERERDSDHRRTYSILPLKCM